MFYDDQTIVPRKQESRTVIKQQNDYRSEVILGDERQVKVSNLNYLMDLFIANWTNKPRIPIRFHWINKT